MVAQRILAAALAFALVSCSLFVTGPDRDWRTRKTAPTCAASAVLPGVDAAIGTVGFVVAAAAAATATETYYYFEDDPADYW